MFLLEYQLDKSLRAHRNGDDEESNSKIPSLFGISIPVIRTPPDMIDGRHSFYFLFLLEEGFFPHALNFIQDSINFAPQSLRFTFSPVNMETLEWSV